MDRCKRCFGQILNGKCACGLHTTIQAVPYQEKGEFDQYFEELVNQSKDLNKEAYVNTTTTKYNA